MRSISIHTPVRLSSIILACVMPYCLFCHPHIFIDYTVTFVFNENGLSAIKVLWFFDEMYSCLLLEDYDIDYDTTFNDTEIKTLNENAFSHLIDDSYFTEILVEDRNYSIRRAQQFTAYLEDNRVVYSFSLPCSVAVTTAHTHVLLAMYDKSYYIDFLPAPQDPATYENATHIVMSYEIVEIERKGEYLPEMYIDAIECTFRKGR